MLTSKWSSESSSSEHDNGEISSSVESPTETPNERSERTIKIRDDPSEDTDPSPLLLSSDASELIVDTYEGPAGDGESEADADAEDSDDWESELEPHEYTITELVNKINCNKIDLPDEAVAQKIEVPSDDNKDTSAAGYQFLKTRVEMDKIMNAFRESRWPLDLATGKRIDPALKLAKKAEKANIHQKREKADMIGEERKKDWGSDEEKGKGNERGKEGEGESGAESNEEWKDEEQVKKRSMQEY